MARHLIKRILILLLTSSSCGLLSAQDYPSRPLRIVTPEVGGAADVAARLFGQGLASNLGQQVVIDNRGGVAGGEVVGQAPPGGITLLFFGALFLVGPFFFQKGV